MEGRAPALALKVPRSAFRVQSKKPVRLHRTGFEQGSWRRPTLPRPRSRSTIGADRLNDRVRDGNGCGPVALVASRIRGVWCQGPGVRGKNLTPDTQHPKPDEHMCDAEAHLEREEIKPHGQLVRLGRRARGPC